MYSDILERLPMANEKTIVVFGDYCLDKYLFIDALRDEPSVETGLTAWQVGRKAIFPGAAGTVAKDILALGARVVCVGFVGEDGEGFEMLHALEGLGANTSLMIKTPLLCTNTYTKPMRTEPDGRVWEMNRFDFRNFVETPDKVQEALIKNLREAVKTADAVVITDQFIERNLCVVTDRVREELAAVARENPRLIVFADSRARIDEYRNIMVKCNNFECVRAVMPDHTGAIDRETLEKCGKILESRNGRPVFITQGADGMLIFGGREIFEAKGIPVTGEIDIVGAGDAANSGIVLGLALGLSLEAAGMLGNMVASIAIKQIGVTGQATREQVEALIKGLG